MPCPRCSSRHPAPCDSARQWPGWREAAKRLRCIRAFARVRLKAAFLQPPRSLILSTAPSPDAEQLFDNLDMMTIPRSRPQNMHGRNGGVFRKVTLGAWIAARKGRISAAGRQRSRKIKAVVSVKVPAGDGSDSHQDTKPPNPGESAQSPVASRQRDLVNL